MQKIIQSLEEWRQANADARKAEGRLATALRVELDGGAPVQPALVKEVSRLREVANERLSAALALMSGPEAEKAKSLR
jgi:hypothetical protein